MKKVMDKFQKFERNIIIKNNNNFQVMLNNYFIKVYI